jgi:hypothetical protein
VFVMRRLLRVRHAALQDRRRVAAPRVSQNEGGGQLRGLAPTAGSITRVKRKIQAAKDA